MDYNLSEEHRMRVNLEWNTRVKTRRRKDRMFKKKKKWLKMKLHLSSNADQIFDVRGEPGIKTRAKTLRRKDRMFFKKNDWKWNCIWASKTDQIFDVVTDYAEQRGS